MIKLHDDNMLLLAPCKLLLRPKPKWNRHLAVVDSLSSLIPLMPEVDRVPNRTLRLGSESANFLRDFRLVCPSCKTNKPHHSIDPFVSNQWRVLKCANPSCCHVASAKAWLCQCHRLWYGCPLHSDWIKHVKCAQLSDSSKHVKCTLGSHVSNQRIPVLSGIRRFRACLSPRKRSARTSHHPMVGGAPFVGGRKPTSDSYIAHRKGATALGPGRSCANSTPSSSSGPQSSTQVPSASCGIPPTSADASFGASSSGSTIRTRQSQIASEVNIPCPRARLANSSSSTQVPLNTCSSGGATRVRQTRPASGGSAQAKSKSRKLGSQPIAAPSSELLAKLAERFLHQKKHPKGDG